MWRLSAGGEEFATCAKQPFGRLAVHGAVAFLQCAAEVTICALQECAFGDASAGCRPFRKLVQEGNGLFAEATVRFDGERNELVLV